MNYTIAIAALMIAVVIGILLFRRSASVAVPITSAPKGQQRQHQDSRSRHKSHANEGGATLWVGALEAAMALVMVLVTLALTDAATATRPTSTGVEQVIIDATPEAVDEQPSAASAANGASPVRPTHRLVALESSAIGDGGAIIIELDSPLPVDRPVKFLINIDASPQ